MPYECRELDGFCSEADFFQRGTVAPHVGERQEFNKGPHSLRLDWLCRSAVYNEILNARTLTTYPNSRPISVTLLEGDRYCELPQS
jgi:hypothetical protein